MQDVGHWAPKVHPLDRAVEADDPMILMAEPATGDPDVMLECLLQEYAELGWEADDLLALFRSPLYPVLNQLRAWFGDQEIAQRITMLMEQTGFLRVSAQVCDEVDDDHEPNVVQIGLADVLQQFLRERPAAADGANHGAPDREGG